MKLIASTLFALAVIFAPQSGAAPARTLFSAIPSVASGHGAVGAYPITLADGSLASPGTVTETAGAADNTIPVAVSPDGAYLYAVNTGSDTVAVFTVNADGSLTLKSTSPQIIPMASAIGVAVAPDGKHVYVVGNSGQHNPGSTTQTEVAALKVSAVDG
ncbi:MAG TPA: beta-propeller fold lactonase family protein, partial [Chthoniobacterales bacterium]